MVSSFRGCLQVPLPARVNKQFDEVNARGFASPQESIMSTQTVLIIIVVLLVLGGGGYYGYGRWF